MSRLFSLSVLVTVLFLSYGCADKDTTQYRGKAYPPTDRIATVFHHSQVPKPCRVFAELLVQLPANVSGLDIRRKIFKEAGAHGTDLILVGQSRQSEDDEGLRFTYYGPAAEYNCADKWCGWKYGYDAWEEQGDWVNIGYKEWGNGEVSFEYPVMMQAAFLRCR